MPTVSVCIPSFNHARFIGECIESVLSQSIQDLEVLVTDDASSDHSIEVIETFKDSRVKVERHATTLGPSAAINSAVRRASGKYVAILGSDDLFLPNKLAEQVAILQEEPNIDAAYALVHGIDEMGKRVPDDTFPAPAVFQQVNRSRAEWLRRFFYEGNCLCASTALIRRDVMARIGDHDPRLLQLQDFDYWIRVCLAGDIHVVQRPLVAYRIRTNQVNLSGDRPEANARSQWEAHKVLRHFLSIGDRGLLLEIFPELRPLADQTIPLRYLIASAALRSRQPGVRLFGLDALFEMLGRDDERAQLQRQGIFAPTLSRLVGELDPLNIQTIAELKAEIAVLERALARGGWTVGEWSARICAKVRSAVRRWQRRRYRPK